MTRSHSCWLLFALLLLLAGACRKPAATPTEPSPSAPAEMAADVEMSATTAPTETAAPAPTATAVPPSPTIIPTETAIPEPTATPTATPVRLLSAADFGENRNPLTGEIVENPAVLQRRPIAVKISNSPPSWVRPQSGLSQADLVFEHVTEGSITRFTAVIWDETPEDMGPIRSGRLIDVEIPAMYDAAFAYSGSSIGVARLLFASDFVERILRANVQGYYRTGEDKPWEHTLYGEPALWWAELDARELNNPPAYRQLNVFTEAAPEGGDPADHLHIDYNSQMIVDWFYDEESGRYLRWADDEEHTDQNTGEQLSAANVVVVYATHVLDRTICEYIPQGSDTCQAWSMEIQVWGEGRARVLRNGRVYEATWKREQRDDMLTFFDPEGEPLPLNIGNTWFQMVPSYYDEEAVIVE